MLLFKNISINLIIIKFFLFLTHLLNNILILFIQKKLKKLLLISLSETVILAYAYKCY
ncbi:MAG: hypothetical protein Q8755_00220 [Candidatus Phytoplasma australasiaticum]|nr:hypothetical protein [Candidatus Phytoplasma australasiaticum]